MKQKDTGYRIDYQDIRQLVRDGRLSYENAKFLVQNYYKDGYIVIENANKNILGMTIGLLLATYCVANVINIAGFIYNGRFAGGSKRIFSDKIRAEVAAKQGMQCPMTDKTYYNLDKALSNMDADHVIPYSKGGQTTVSNMMMVDKSFNRSKGSDINPQQIIIRMLDLDRNLKK